MDIPTLFAAVNLCKKNSGGSGSIETNISNPQDGQTLVYDAASQKWVNGSGGSSGGGTVVVHMDGSTHALDMKTEELFEACLNSHVVVYTPAETNASGFMVTILFVDIPPLQSTEENYMFNGAYVEDNEFTHLCWMGKIGEYPVLDL